MQGALSQALCVYAFPDILVSGALSTATDQQTIDLMNRYAANGGTLPCYGTTRYEGADERRWIGEPHCDFADMEVIPSSCRRCLTVSLRVHACVHACVRVYRKDCLSGGAGGTLMAYARVCACVRVRDCLP